MKRKKNENQPAPEFISSESLAPVLGISARTVRRMKNAGLLPFYVLGHATKYRQEECMAAMARLRVAAKNESI